MVFGHQIITGFILQVNAQLFERKIIILVKYY